MRFRYLASLYGFRSAQSGLSVPELGEAALDKMAAHLVGSDDLVAIYVPEGTEEVYRPGTKRGRVVGGVRLLRMPKDKTTRDYFCHDWDGSLRWPVGWPCRAVYAPPVEECPMLRDIVGDVYGPNRFQSYVAQLQRGPFKLGPTMADRLDKWFARVSRVSDLAEPQGLK